MRKVWIPTGKVFTEIVYSWKPTGRNFTIIGNRCPLTRITLNKILPPKETTITPVVTPTSGILVYSRRPKATRSIGSSSKVVQIILWYLDFGCSKHMTGNRSQLINFISKFLGTVRFGNDHIAKIMGYGDYQMGNLSGLNVEGLGLPKLKYQKDHLCSACALGKRKKYSYKPKAKDSIQEKLYLLHMDLCGPIRVKFLRSKDELLEFVIKFLKMIQVRLNATVCNIRTNNGTEFVNQTLRDYYEEVRISHQTSVARTPQQNGVVERQNHTLVEAARTMLIFSKALLFLWAEAIATACYTQN
ncbi:retrovirus-related pol polyprotein from transposon TNT 1-94 [Tanacetum coccineum]